MSSREYWDTVCQRIGVPISVATIWYEKLAANYNEKTRYYHNEQVLLQKFNFLKHNVIANSSDNGDVMLRSHLMFAIFFQYYHFDVKRNCCTENCQEFRNFYNQDAALNDVS